MRVHCCLFDRECRAYGAPPRLQLHFRWGTLFIGARTQAWLPLLGYLPPRWWTWWFIAWHPSKRRYGWLVSRHPEWWGLNK